MAGALHTHPRNKAVVNKGKAKKKNCLLISPVYYHSSKNILQKRRDDHPLANHDSPFANYDKHKPKYAGDVQSVSFLQNYENCVFKHTLTNVLKVQVNISSRVFPLWPGAQNPWIHWSKSTSSWDPFDGDAIVWRLLIESKGRFMVHNGWIIPNINPQTHHCSTFLLAWNHPPRVGSSWDGLFIHLQGVSSSLGRI